MTPHHLHALAAAWSLHTARTRLAHLARTEATRNTSTLLDAAAILRSSSAYGIRHGVGGHGDPVSGLLTAERAPERETTWADLLERLDGKLRWLAGQLPTPAPIADDGDPIARHLADIGRLLPGTAAVVAQHLADEDAWVRDAIRQPRPCRPLIGVACPCCGERRLYLQTAGPETAWTVVCAAGCRCVGEGCPCGMPGAVEGVAHIWPRHAVIAPSKAKPGAAAAAPGCKSPQSTPGAVAGAAQGQAQ